MQNFESLTIVVPAFSLILCSACVRSDRDEARPRPDHDTDAAEPWVDEASGDSVFSVVLTDFSAESQIDFVHSYDGHGQRYVVEPVASGMATLDFDSDGLIDVYFLSGAPVHAEDGQHPPNALYRNLGAMRFTNVTEQCAADDLGFSTGVAVADFDNDGFPDIFVNNYGPNKLYRNNGDGTFMDVTNLASVAGGQELGAGACFLDSDGNGLLDLYVGNYVQRPVEDNTEHTTDGYPSYPGPLDFDPEVDFFFHNDGDGSFSDRSAASGISSVATTSMGVIAADYDDDKDTDVLVVNDVERNLLFENDGTGNFEEVGIQRGIAFSHDAQRNGNMGVDCADYNNDGQLDFFTTTFSNDLPVLYRNDGFGNFVDVTLASGAGSGMMPHANWGTSFFDVDNDGDRDLVVANGHVDPNVNRWAYTTAWKVANTLLLNLGNGQFKNISEESGSGLKPIESSRGLVTDDFDNDGDVDVMILNSLSRPTVLRNETKPSGNWLQIRLHGRNACRDGTGAKVTLEFDGTSLVDEVHSGRGYQSSYGQRLHFGLGETSGTGKLTIRWPTGEEQVIDNVATNQILNIVQD